MQLTPKQLEAIELCTSDKRLVGVTGAAGTGKTTITREAYYKVVGDDFENPKARAVLCAPTGKAAKRITQATGIPACTIHRLLEFPKPGEYDEKTGKPLQTGFPRRNKRYPLEVDFVFVDEAAMINNDLFRFLIDALPNRAVVRMFGDVNQLPPIEDRKKGQEPAPSPFTTVLRRQSSVTLDVVHRQEAESGVLANAQRVLRGLPPMIRPDFEVRITEQPVDTVLQECKKHDFTTLSNQIISPTNQGWIGVLALNTRVQSVVNAQPDPNRWISLPRHKWDERRMLNIAIGDKVVQTANNYDLEVFNGETGIVKSVDKEEGSLVVDFDGHEIEIPPVLERVVIDQYGEVIDRYYTDPRKDIDLAYVLTTHKCQGSEYDTVLYVLNRSRSFNLNRSNFYTAITRARKHCILVSDRYSITKSLATQVK